MLKQIDVDFEWNNPQTISGIQYECGYCGVTAAPTLGWSATAKGTSTVAAYVLICPACKRASFHSVDESRTIPGPMLGESVPNLPDNILDLYNEARTCLSIGANRAAIIISRTLLLHLARAHGMSRKGNPWDNAPVESFFASLKTEGFQKTQFRDLEHVRSVAWQYIENTYHRQRLHSTLSYTTPVQCERAFQNELRVTMQSVC